MSMPPHSLNAATIALKLVVNPDSKLCETPTMAPPAAPVAIRIVANESIEI